MHGDARKAMTGGIGHHCVDQRARPSRACGSWSRHRAGDTSESEGEVEWPDEAGVDKAVGLHLPGSGKHRTLLPVEAGQVADAEMVDVKPPARIARSHEVVQGQRQGGGAHTVRGSPPAGDGPRHRPARRRRDVPEYPCLIAQRCIGSGDPVVDTPAPAERTHAVAAVPGSEPGDRGLPTQFVHHGSRGRSRKDGLPAYRPRYRPDRGCQQTPTTLTFRGASGGIDRGIELNGLDRPSLDPSGLGPTMPNSVEGRAPPHPSANHLATRPAWNYQWEAGRRPTGRCQRNA